MKVKLLQWEKTGNKYRVVEVAPSLDSMKPYKLERIGMDSGDYYSVYQGLGALHNQSTGRSCFSTRAEAKELAQKDYEREVLKHIDQAEPESKKVICTKCGSEHIHSTFIKDGSLINASSISRVENEFVRCREYEFFYQLTAEKDHLLNKCSDCGNSWRSNCRDEQP